MGVVALGEKKMSVSTTSSHPHIDFHLA